MGAPWQSSAIYSVCQHLVVVSLDKAHTSKAIWVTKERPSDAQEVK